MSASEERVVVTGGAGFIGSHVAEILLEQGASVLIVDNLLSGFSTNVPTGAEFANVDIVDHEALRHVVMGFRPDAICHLAAQSSVTVSVHSPELDLDINVRGTYNVCELGRLIGAPVVFSSTGGALYGDAAPVPSPEDTRAEPLAPYGASKLAGEAYVATWGRLYGLPNVILRLGNVYGPRQSPHGEAGVVAIFSDHLIRGEAPVVYGDGRQTRDYIHVTDVAAAFIAATRAGIPGTFNVAWGAGIDVTTLLRHLQAAANTQLQPVFQPLRQGELRQSALDPTRIKQSLEWSPQITLEHGLGETFRWYARTPPAGAPHADPA